MKNCAKCEKTVYPTEELKCLDKVWHKGCFRCWECSMMLSMKNYKGYDKLPYCGAHCPKPKHTQVADTPENKRLGENTKLQSQLQYHSEFEQAKGQYTSVADDPETLRNLQNQKVVSQNVYHSDFVKSLSRYTAVADDPETLRVQKNQKAISQIKYHEEFEKAKGLKTSVVDDPETLRVRKIQDQVSQINYQDHMSKATMMERQRATIDSDPQGPPSSGYGSQGYGSPAPGYGVPPSPSYGGPPAPSYGGPPAPSYSSPAAPSYGGPARNGMSPGAAMPLGQSIGFMVRPPEPEPPRAVPPQGPRFRAMYDYQAADDDEVSFLDGDVIINVQQIDEGWMTGTVERNRKSGMLPANYVERIS